MGRIRVVGAGLAGSEAALRLSSFGYDVDLIEMRPGVMTPAHRTDSPAELVCSNSLKSLDPDTASGLLKRELGMLDCDLLRIAEKARVPAGHALAVDREVFSRLVKDELEGRPRIRLLRLEQTSLDIDRPAVIATGPLTSESLSGSISGLFGRDSLHFYDAISISVSLESLDTSRMYKASRYGKGGDDYWNVPLDEEQYRTLVGFLRSASTTAGREFEEKSCFEACLPVEVSAGRGEDALRFGPLKPRGLADPSTGTEPYAVLQLRQESISGAMLGLVGFQTRMTRRGQKEMMRLIPGFEKAEIVRFGSIHRNSFIESPELLDEGQMARSERGLFFAGQLCGVEGYVESIAHGLISALNVRAFMEGREYPVFPPETVLGGLQRHLFDRSRAFQPMNANFGLLPPVKGKRAERKAIKSARSIEAMTRFVSTLGMPRHPDLKGPEGA